MTAFNTTTIWSVLCICILCLPSIICFPLPSPSHNNSPKSHHAASSSPPVPAASAALSAATFHLDPTPKPVDTSHGPCSRGVDISSYAYVEDFVCMRKLGFNFAIIRAWQSDCSVDPSAIQTIENAEKAGMKEIDIYLFPSFGCALTAQEQVEEVLKNVNATSFHRAWLDVEPRGSGWSVDKRANEQFVRLALDTMARILGNHRVGVYSSFFGFPAVVGDSVVGYNQYKLWFGAPTDDPSSAGHLNGGMGGWNRGDAFMRQYSDEQKVCGHVVGLDAREGSNAQCQDVNDIQLHGNTRQQMHEHLLQQQQHLEQQVQQQQPPKPQQQQQQQPQQVQVGDDGDIEFVDDKPTPPPAPAPIPVALTDQWLTPTFTDEVAKAATAAIPPPPMPSRSHLPTVQHFAPGTPRAYVPPKPMVDDRKGKAAARANGRLRKASRWQKPEFKK